MKQLVKLIICILVGAIIGAIIFVSALTVLELFSNSSVGDSTDNATDIWAWMVLLYGAIAGFIIGGIIGAVVWLVKKSRSNKNPPIPSQ